MAALEGGAARHRVRVRAARRPRRSCSCCAPGDHVVACDDVYGGTFRILDKVFAPLGIEFDWVDMTEPRNVERGAAPEHALIWVETPTNPLLKIVDIARASRGSRGRRGVPLAVDNTFATPVLQRPLELGADAGRALDDQVPERPRRRGRRRDRHQRRGARASACASCRTPPARVPSPFDCYLVLRGAQDAAAARAPALRRPPRALAALARAPPDGRARAYPGLRSHPQHALAARQMALPGGDDLASCVRGGLARGRARCSSAPSSSRAPRASAASSR